MKDLDSILSGLKKNPLFYVSQASKELFHSNFWDWLAVLNTGETIKIFYDKIIWDKTLKFKREHNQTFKKEPGNKTKDIKSRNDFVLFKGNGKKTEPLLVIENKVKDFPNDEQLQRIKKSFNNENIQYLLVTLFWEENLKFDGWNNIIRYNDIADRIQPEKFSTKEFDLALIIAYKEFCTELHSLAENLPITDKYDFIYSLNRPLLTKLNNVKLAEGYQKMRASHFLMTYKKPFDFIECSYGINNQKVTIGFAYPLNDGYKIGIQLEGNQFRRFVQGQNHVQFANRVLNIPFFFDSNWKSPKEKLLFLGYNPNFTYQYKPITAIRTYADLSAEINELLIEIHNRKDEIESQISY